MQRFSAASFSAVSSHIAEEAKASGDAWLFLNQVPCTVSGHIAEEAKASSDARLFAAGLLHGLRPQLALQYRWVLVIDWPPFGQDKGACPDG